MTEYLNYIQVVNFLVLLWLLCVLRRHPEAYASEKGKNLATKEDVGEITRIVESARAASARELEEIRHHYRSILDTQGQRHQLRMAALERRLQAHQEAYTLWWNLLGAVHDEQRIGKIVMDCQDWWVKNCLYLDPEARRAFSAAYHAAHMHKDLLRPVLQAEAAKQNWDVLQKAGQAIVRGVDLPSLGESEYLPVQPSAVQGS